MERVGGRRRRNLFPLPFRDFPASNCGSGSPAAAFPGSSPPLRAFAAFLDPPLFAPKPPAPGAGTAFLNLPSFHLLERCSLSRGCCRGTWPAPWFGCPSSRPLLAPSVTSTPGRSRLHTRQLPGASAGWRARFRANKLLRDAAAPSALRGAASLLGRPAARTAAWYRETRRGSEPGTGPRAAHRRLAAAARPSPPERVSRLGAE